MSVWTLQARLSRQLLLWSALSVVLGSALLLVATPFWRGVGLQGLVWGVIDAAIALFGLLSMRKKQARADAHALEVMTQEARKLRRLLRINAGLDVLYVIAGMVILFSFATDFARGNGVGVIVQGGFLLVFDAFYASRLKIP